MLGLASSEGLGVNADGSVEKLRCKVRAIRPHKCSQFWMYSELTKDLDVLKWFKDWPMQFVREINLPFDPIIKTNPNRVGGDMASIRDVRQHSHYSSGSILGSGLLARASDQAFSSSAACMSFHSSTWAMALLGKSPLTFPVATSTVISKSP